MDMLVKLYELSPDPKVSARMEAEGVTIRRLLAPLPRQPLNRRPPLQDSKQG